MGKMEIINGFDPILHLFENNNKLVEFVVNNTYFFDPALVIIQKGEMEEPFYVRISEEKEYFKSCNENDVYTGGKNNRLLYKYTTTLNKRKREPNENQQLFIKDLNGNFRRVIIDKDNNKKVRDEIKKYTKQIVSEGAQNTMRNFVITHIWGNATDPDYFSFMWNFCITPSFAASLTDKNKPNEGTPEKLLQDTLRKIAKLLYVDNLAEDVEDVDIEDSVVLNMKINLLRERGNISKGICVSEVINEAKHFDKNSV